MKAGKQMKPLDIMEDCYRHRDLAARKWKKAGGKVVGYLCVDVPEELIMAAGFFPLRLSGEPWAGTAQADKYTAPVYEGFIRSIFQMLLTGAYDFLDFLVIPHSRDAIEALHSILSTVKHIEPTGKIPELFLFDTPHTKFWRSSRYLHERVKEFKVRLDDWSGREITERSISEAIKTCNENRRILKQIEALRIADPPRVSGVEALQLIGSSMFMLKEEHSNLLGQFIDGAGHLPPKEGMRLFVEASPLDNVQLYEILEASGGVVVAEDNCWGNRNFDTLVDESLDPLEGLVTRYQKRSPCPRMYPLKARVDYCVRSAKEARAQGVVFSILEWDYAQTWEYPDEENAFKAEGIPAITFKKQKYLIPEADKEEIKARMERFVETVARSLSICSPLKEGEKSR